MKIRRNFALRTLVDVLHRPKIKLYKKIYNFEKNTGILKYII